MSERRRAPAATDFRLHGVPHELTSHPPAGSLREAAEQRGLPPSAVLKTMVVRIRDGEYVFVLVPGDRVIDWPKLRNHLGERRLSLSDRDEAFEATGYEPGTITPFGSRQDWPVIVDTTASKGVVSIGAGLRGHSLRMRGEDLVRALAATVADVTRVRE